MRKKIFKIASVFLIIILITLIPRVVVAKGLWAAVREPLAGLAVDQILKLWIIGSLRETQLFFDSIYENLIPLILVNPTIESLSPGLNFFLSLVLPFYIFGILLTGIYLLFLSGSPAGRAMAKGNLLKLIYSLILISISPLLLKFLFLVSSSATSYVINLVPIETGIGILKGATDGFYAMMVTLYGVWVKAEGAGLFFGGVFAMTYYLFYIILMGRLVFVTFFAMLLPLTMFLYSFYSTRGLGRTLLRQLLFVTFTQVMWGITLAGFVIAVPNIYQHVPIPEVIVNISAYVIFWFAPMVLLGIMEWFALVVFVIDATTTGPLCVGPVVMDELYAGREIVPEEVTAPEYM